MGATGGIPKGIRKPSQTAYFVALGGILILLLMLCLYFFYFFIKKVKELSSSDALIQPTTSCRPTPAPSGYPVAPVVRDSASAMAKLCKQVPATGKTDTVFPMSTSPAAQRTDVGGTNTIPETPDPNMAEQVRSDDANDPNLRREAAGHEVDDRLEAVEVNVDKLAPPTAVAMTNDVVSAR